MAYNLTDSQREILGREMPPESVDRWAANIVEYGGAEVLETKIDIIANQREPHPYDEMRRRGYPDIGDQLDDLYHKGVFSDEMAAKLKAVKDANPVWPEKPE